MFMHFLCNPKQFSLAFSLLEDHTISRLEKQIKMTIIYKHYKAFNDLILTR